MDTGSQRTKDRTLPDGPTSLLTDRTTLLLTSSTTAPTITADSTRTDVRLVNSETTRKTTAIRLPSTTVTPASPGTDGVTTTPTTTKLAAEMFVTRVLTPETTTTKAGVSKDARSGTERKKVRSTMATITVTPTTTSVELTTEKEMSGVRTPETTPMAGPLADTTITERDTHTTVTDTTSVDTDTDMPVTPTVLTATTVSSTTATLVTTVITITDTTTATASMTTASVDSLMASMAVSTAGEQLENTRL